MFMSNKDENFKYHVILLRKVTYNRIEKEGISLTFVNYNYAFRNFYEHYEDLCIKLSEKNLLSDISEIGTLISSFIYEYDYTIKDEVLRFQFRDKLRKITQLMQNDEEIVKILNNDKDLISNRLKFYRKYYNYFIMYLELLGSFAFELTSTFMPNTNIQKKLLRFSNNQAFFEKFSHHKKIVLEGLSNFRISNFNEAFNKLIIFYFAYLLFINEQDRGLLNKIFSNILSIYLSDETFKHLHNDSLTISQVQFIKGIAYEIHQALLFCNSKMNVSFSNYDVLPKIQKKIYIDKTLI